MLNKTMLEKFKVQRFGTNLQKEIADDYEVRIRQTKKSYPAWELSVREKSELLPLFDDLVLFACNVHFIVEKTNATIAYKGWHTWAINVEEERD